MSVLGLVPPVISNGDVLIDGTQACRFAAQIFFDWHFCVGGYVDNMPVDVMYTLANPALLIAVDVENKAIPSTLQQVYDYGWCQEQNEFSFVL